MRTQIVRLQTKSILNWETFHGAFAETLGFPDFYGCNMNAWIDCMTYLDDKKAGMTKSTVSPGELFHLEVADARDFLKRVPQIFQAFTECAAFVNWRRLDKGNPPVLALILL
jgi:Barstar (barnase inhibitor)